DVARGQVLVEALIRHLSRFEPRASFSTESTDVVSTATHQEQLGIRSLFMNDGVCGKQKIGVPWQQDPDVSNDHRLFGQTKSTPHFRLFERSNAFDITTLNKMHHGLATHPQRERPTVEGAADDCVRIS